MSVTRGLMLSAVCGLMLAGFPVAAGAQVYEDARKSLDFSPDATARSPRLLGMGRLTLAGDVHNGINLWDFAGNPLGVLEADSVSTLDLWPGTSSADARHVPTGTSRERESLAGREMRVGYEAWRRGEGTAYGFYGDVASLRSDRPFDETTVVRGRFEEPRVFAVLNGHMPRFHSERLHYVLHGFYSSEVTSDEYRTFSSNAEGDYLGRESVLQDPPNFFDPDEFRVSTLGGGAGISFDVAPWMTTAAVGTVSSSRIEGENSSVIHSTGTGEDRPYYGAQVSAVGRLPSHIEYGLDGRMWTSSSEERFVFTLKAGQNQDPFTGRGKVLDRDEDGTEGRARLRWTLGALEINAGARRWARTVDITPPAPGDPRSYNYFLDVADNRDGADSLALPDSVRRSSADDKAWELAYGATWHLPNGKGLVGLEYHFAKETRENSVFQNPVAVPGGDPLSYQGLGPDRRTWDIRGGLEYACTPVLKGRLGYIHRSDDRDERTNRSEFKSRIFTAGLGLKPLAASWSFDLGWALDWISPDFADATEPKESRQQMAAQIRWVF